MSLSRLLTKSAQPTTAIKLASERRRQREESGEKTNLLVTFRDFFTAPTIGIRTSGDSFIFTAPSQSRALL
jgi:hypothetical protein